MSATPSDEQQVAVRLTTRLEAPWRVTEAPIQLPTRLTRFGLSEVVNHLLQGQPTRPFDFVLNGELLRGSLAKAMVKHGLSGEEVVVLEYIQLLAPPKPEQHAPNPDWVASIAVLHSSGYSSGSTLAAKAPLLSACYDGCAYAWSGDGTKCGTLSGHTGALKAVRWLTPASPDTDPASSNSARAITASKDHTVRLWHLQSSSAGAKAGAKAGSSHALDTRCEAVCAAHTDAVETLAVSPDASQFASAGWDGSIRLWTCPTGGEVALPPPKRSKGAKGVVSAPPTSLDPTTTLSGHSNCVSSLCWSTAALLYSGSWDGCIKEWDMTTETATVAFSSMKATLCMDVSLGSMSVASGHSDHLLRLWDARTKGSTVRQSLKHNAWVSDVRWSTANPLHLLSSCHDGAVRLWDIRSSVALHELPSHEDKALCVAFLGADRLVSGGADAELRISRLGAAGAEPVSEAGAEPADK